MVGLGDRYGIHTTSTALWGSTAKVAIARATVYLALP